MSTTTTQVTTPVAPAMGPQGSSTPGGHYVAYRNQSKFDLGASLKLVSTVNPWRPNTPGHAFYVGVLSQGPATVGAAIELAKSSKPRSFKASEVQAHLRWLYTWGGAYLEVNGKLFAAPPATATAPVQAPSKPRGKK